MANKTTSSAMLNKVVCVVIMCALASYIAISFKDDFDEGSLHNKRVLVTGASSGIGEQLAYQFARFGANVVVTSRRESVLKQVVERCRQVGRKNGGQYYHVAGDMMNETFYSRLIEMAVAKLGGLDYVVLNHIVQSPIGEWLGMPDNLTMIRTMVDVNFLSYINLASLALPHLERSSGSLVIVSSFAGRVPALYNVAYSSTKFALNGFFNGLRHELTHKQSNVSVTVCTIGLIGTQNTVEKMQTFGLQKMLDLVPPANPADTALAIVKGGAARHRDVYFPYISTRLSTIVGTLFPRTFEQIENLLYDR